MDDIMIRHITSRLVVPCFLLVFVFACYPAPKARLDVFRYDSPEGQQKHLFVFLPGHGDSPHTFWKKGLVQAVRARKLPVDMIAVDAHIGYYMEGTIFDRLKQDVIEPAKAGGYRRIWLVGNSMGGYGSISYARLFPQDVAGVILLGPFLGDRKIIQQIRDAGGLAAWEPGELPRNGKDNWETQLWKWLKDGSQQKDFWLWVRDCDEENSCPARVYLGYGKRDRFAPGQKLMAESLPIQDVIEIDGGHNWSTWRKLWDMILDRLSRPKKPPESPAH